MFKKFKEWLSVFIVKNPSRAILIAILLLNVLLFFIAGFVISRLAASTSLEQDGFWASVYYTISMVLDAGCIDYVIEDLGSTSVALILVCLGTVLIGMITFTGAVIGYVTNYISNFIEHSESGARALHTSGHTVILNWNSRASEIVNDLLYTGHKETVVVLVMENADAIKREIDDRLSATFKEEQKALLAECAGMNFLKRIAYYRLHKLRNRLTIIVREGETYSTKQLNDISVSQAATIIILSKDIQNTMCKYDFEDRRQNLEKGNSNTVKTLVQVAEMTSAEDSADDQVIIVEIEDSWTENIVNQIIKHKERLGKCNIVPVPVNKILGQILSQFSIMPELNTVYSDLFSNKGAEFFCRPYEMVDDIETTQMAYLDTHVHSLPLTLMETKTGSYAYYVAGEEGDHARITNYKRDEAYKVTVNQKYKMSRKSIVIIGHNSKSEDIMNGFEAFRGEHNADDPEEILNITIIDDEASMTKHDNYNAYSYINRKVTADVYDAKEIRAALEQAIDDHEGDTSILILSDDMVTNEDIDSAALTYLIYVRDIIFERKEADPDFDEESVDVVVEILNPKNYDVVHNYSVNNVVISNRYISKMVTQIGRKQALYEFYADILTYDAEGATSFESKELYIKDVKDFYAKPTADGKGLITVLPEKTTAAELIRATYDASPENNKAVVIGYASPGGKMTLFEGDQREIEVSLTARDKLIVFSNH